MAKKKKLSKADQLVLDEAVREYWQIKKTCFEGEQWKPSVTLSTRQKLTKLEETISSLNSELLDFEKLPKSFLDYL